MLLSLRRWGSPFISTCHLTPRSRRRGAPRSWGTPARLGTARPAPAGSCAVRRARGSHLGGDTPRAVPEAARQAADLQAAAAEVRSGGCAGLPVRIAAPLLL